jgi:hypothetical protein
VQVLHTLMADNLRTQIRHPLMKSIDEALVLHTWNTPSLMAHSQQQLMTSTKMHQESAMAHNDFLPTLSCHRQLIETLAALVRFLGW